jgi:hypothetical protein
MIHIMYIWVCLKIVYPFIPNGFADHYPKNKWLFHWEYSLFSDDISLDDFPIGKIGPTIAGSTYVNITSELTWLTCAGSRRSRHPGAQNCSQIPSHRPLRGSFGGVKCFIFNHVWDHELTFFLERVVETT